MKTVWSLPYTLLFSILIGLGFVLSQLVLLLGWAATYKFFAGDAGNMRVFVSQLAESGIFFGATSILSAIVIHVLVWFFIRLKRGFSFRKYLALETFRVKDFLIWLGIALVWMWATSSLLSQLGYPDINPFVEKMYRTCKWLPILWIGVSLGAPWGEEIFIRGFIFQSVAYSRLGIVGAIIGTSVIWTLAHLQYELAYLTVIFGIGIIFGLARYYSGSLWVPLIIHVLWNLNSLLMTHFAVKQN